MSKSFRTIGVMSGTSLDGLDIAYCEFFREKDRWKYTIREAKTIKYPADLYSILSNSMNISGYELSKLNTDYGKFIGDQVGAFISEHKLEKIDLVASHGHTVFHDPAIGLTLQIGDGASIAARTKLTTICDFRTLDVALGGQGAPLVPIGDELLFGEYTYCLNLGGFANISMQNAGKRIAYDICPVNIAANYLAQNEGLEYDIDGKLGASGKIIPQLLSELNSLPFYGSKPPKSLGKEWFLKSFLPILEKGNFLTEDLLHTLYEHITYQIAASIKHKGTILVTGGGANNNTLMDMLRQKCISEIVVPEKKIIDYKEALVFAFLGLLRYTNQTNVLCSVTGSTRDSVSGCTYTG